MQYLFTNLSSVDMAAVKQLKLKTLALLLVYVVKSNSQSSGSQSAKALCHFFITQVDATNK
jgi:hypothetical protein